MYESFQDLIKKIGSYLNLNNQDVILGKIYFLCQGFMSLNHFYDSKMSKEDILNNTEFCRLKDFLKDYLIAAENLTSVIHKLSNLFLESRELFYFKLNSYQNNRNVQVDNQNSHLYIKYNQKNIYITFETFETLLDFKRIKQYQKYPKLLNNLIYLSLTTDFKSGFRTLKLPKSFYQRLKYFKINTEFIANPIHFNLDYYCCPFLESDLEIGNIGKIKNISHTQESSGCFITPELDIESILKLKQVVLNLLSNLEEQKRKYNILVLLPKSLRIDNEVFEPLIKSKYYQEHQTNNYQSMNIHLILLSTYKTNTYSKIMERLL